MTARTAGANKAALTRARERREKLDEAVRAQEQRQDMATAVASVALERLAEVEAARDAVVADVGSAVRALMEEDVTAERAAGLLDIDVAEVRRLSKVVPVEEPAASTWTSTAKVGGKATVESLPDRSGSETAVLQVD